MGESDTLVLLRLSLAFWLLLIARMLSLRRLSVRFVLLVGVTAVSVRTTYFSFHGFYFFVLSPLLVGGSTVTCAYELQGFRPDIEGGAVKVLGFLVRELPSSVGE